MKSYPRTVWFISIFMFFNVVGAYSIVPTQTSTPASEIIDETESSEVPESMDGGLKETYRTIFDMDLLGDGESEKFKIENKVVSDSASNRASRLTVERVKPDGGLEAVESFSYPDAFRVQIDVSPLDPQRPKKTFLIVNCQFGSTWWERYVYEYDGKDFKKVNSDSTLWGHPKLMKDGVYAILVWTSGFISKGPDIYTYQKGYLVPSNYKYPEIYQHDIDEIYNIFNDSSYESWQKIQICSRELMKFLYVGKVKEGVQLAQKLEELDSAENREGSLFRAYAHLEMGQDTAGLEELKKITSRDTTQIGFYSLLGDYYYFKNDFKTALKYYCLADDASFASKSRVHQWTRKIKLLQDLLKD